MSKTNDFTATTAEERLERLLSSCRQMQQNLNRLISALGVIDGAIPDRDNEGLCLSDLLCLLIAHQSEEYADFTKEVRLAEGEAA